MPPSSQHHQPLLATIAEWAWSSDPSPNVTPATCLASLPLLTSPCTLRLLAKFIGVTIIASSCINKGKCDTFVFAQDRYLQRCCSTHLLHIKFTSSSHPFFFSIHFFTRKNITSSSNTQHSLLQKCHRSLYNIILRRSYRIFQCSLL